MGDVILVGSISLDGYAAGPHDELDRLHRWMFSAMSAYDVDGDPFVQVFRRAGAVVFGRRTYDLGQEPWGDDDVFDSPVVVVTHEQRPPVRKNGTTFTFVGGSAEQILTTARALAGDGDVVVMGSPSVAQQLLAAGLVDTLLLHQVPVLLGAGIPLFGAPAARVELVPVSMTAGSEVSLVHYAVARDPGAGARMSA
jgi:dihydrofolate reductase